MIEVYGVPAQRLDVACPGVDAERFGAPVPEAEAAAALQRCGVRPPYVLYVGRLERKKNTRRLVEAFTLLKGRTDLPHQLVLAGLPGQGYGEIRQAIERSGLGRTSLMETGWVAEEDLVPLVQRASAFAFVTQYEGFGIPVLEAQAAGVPVVCSDLPVLREAAGEAALFCDQQDPASVARALERALTDPDLRRLVEEGRQGCRRFTWAHCATRLWQSVLRASDRRAPPGGR